MRKVTKDFTNVPTSLLNQQNDLKNITKAQAEKLKHDDTDVKQALQDIYKGKCAYCERFAGTDLEVEHYRPKNSVSLEDLPKKSKAGDYGYYWLRVEWSNLLYACHECNKVGAKGTRFPLEDTKNRIKIPQFDSKTGLPTNTHITDLDAIEKPLLLNPEVTEPRNHLAINAIGEIYELNGSAIGKTTIEICRLQSQPLLLARQEIIDRFSVQIKRQLEFYIAGDLTIEQLKKQIFAIFQEIKEAGNETKPYALVAYCIGQDIKNMLLSERKEILQRLVLRFFEEFLK